MFLLIAFCLLNLSTIESARILAVFPTPSISHQVVFRPLTQALVKRGHEVTVLTPNPLFRKEQAPQNLYEIDVHNISYAVIDKFSSDAKAKKDNIIQHFLKLALLFSKVFDVQLDDEEFKNALNKDENHYDLLLIEACVRPALVISHLFKAPVIQVSSLGSLLSNHKAIGIPIHPLLYPTALHQRLYNLSLWEKLNELFIFALTVYVVVTTEANENQILRNHFGADVPTIADLHDNIDMLFLNIHPIWMSNTPVPPNVVFMGGIHQRPIQELPRDLKSYLDSSKNGVIYVSFGTNVKTDIFSPEKVQLFVNVFSKLPYDVLWKWDQDELPGRTENIKISKWLPQADLLNHKKIKLFITQGGLQSSDEAITAGVPLIGMPILGDQAYNTEQYVHLKIGMKLNIKSLNEEQLSEAIYAVIHNESYRQNIAILRSLMRDQPESPLDRFVWWTEYVLRHGGAKHFRSPAANMSWLQVFNVEMISILLTLLFILFASIFLIIKYSIKLIKLCFARTIEKKNKKDN